MLRKVRILRWYKKKGIIVINCKHILNLLALINGLKKRVIWASQRAKLNLPLTEALLWPFSSSRSIWRWNRNRLIGFWLVITLLNLLAKKMGLLVVMLQIRIKGLSGIIMKIGFQLSLILLNLSLSRLQNGQDAVSLLFMMGMVVLLALISWEINFINWL